jgi:hypothetical protein
MTREKNKIENEFLLEQDEKDNIKYSLPQGEEVLLPCVWIAEAYTPSQINNVFNKAKELGWSEQFTSLNDDFIEVISFWRKGGVRRGWLNLGSIRRTSSLEFQSREAPIPDEIEFINLHLVQVTQSITIMVFMFIFNEKCQRLLNECFKTNYKTYISKNKNVKTYHDVPQQRESDLSVTRAYLKSICVEWVADTFPGVFANFFNKKYPDIELMVFNKFKPGYTKTEEANYIRLLGIDFLGTDLKCCKIKNLYISVENENDVESCRAILYCNLIDCVDGMQLKQCHDDKVRDLLLNMSYFYYNMSSYAVVFLAKILHGVYSELQNKISLILKDDLGLRDATSCSYMINLLNTDFSAFLSDVISDDGKNIAYDSNYFFDFNMTYFYKNQPWSVLLSDSYEFSLKKTIFAVSQLKHQTQEAMNNVISLINGKLNNNAIISNLRMQKIMLLLTVVILFFTIVIGFKDTKYLSELATKMIHTLPN